MALLEGVVTSQDDVQAFSGTVQWPDGKKTSFDATRIKSETKKEGEASEKSKADEGKKDSDKQNAESKVVCDVNFPLGAYGVTSPQERIEWVVFRGATIWTSAEAGILENADLLIHYGHIAKVGKNLEVPEGAKVIDATGMHITPGIIDCHSHMATDGGVNEGSQAVTSEVRIADFIDPTDITIYRQLAGA